MEFSLSLASEELVSEEQMKEQSEIIGTSSWIVDEGPSLRWLKRLSLRYGAGSFVPRCDPYAKSLVKKAAPSLVDELMRTRKRSAVTAEGIARAISKYGCKPARIGTSVDAEVAKAYVRKLFVPKGKVKPLKLTEDMISKIMVGTSNPGYPLSSQFKNQRDCFPQIWEMMNWQLARWKEIGKHHSLPCLVSTRPGILKLDQNEEEKLRGVWMYPAAIKGWEAKFVVPLMEHFKKHPLEYPYVAGINMLKQIPPIIDHLLRDGPAVCYDATAADTSPDEEMDEFGFSVLREFFDMDAEDEEVWDCVVQYFIYTPILMPDGNLYLKRGKVPSGSGFTQLIQTVLNALVVSLATLRTARRLPKIEDIFGVGDDIAFRLDSYPKDFQKSFTQQVSFIGYQINEKKVQFTADPKKYKFLGHKSIGGHVSRDWDELSVMFLFPERFIDLGPQRTLERLNGLLVDAALSCPEMEYFRGRFQRDYGILEMTHELWPSTQRYYKYVLGLDPLKESSMLSMERIFCLS